MGSAAEIVLKLASAVASGQIEPVLALEQFKELEVPHGPEAQQFHAAAAKLHLHAGRHHFFMDSPQDAQALRRCGIEYAVQAVAQSDTDSAAEANAQMDLALLRYDTWFDDDSDLSILRLALDAGERSIAIRGIDSRLTSRWKANLATMYSDAGDRFGEITLFDRGVDLLQDALVNRPTPDPDLPVVQFNLSEILMTRFKRRGAEVDLDEAVKWSELASQSSIGTSWEDHIVGAHGSALAERYRVIGSLSDLERSIEIGYEQLGTGADAGRSYGNLSGRLAKRFDVSGDPADLVEAERLARKAYELSPPARAATPGRFAGWARSVADLATRLPLFNEVSAVLDEFGSMEGDGRDDSDRPPSWSSILYYVSQTIDSALVDRTQQGPISRDRKIELARRAISTATPNEGAWSDQVTWLAVAYLFDRRVANEGAVESDETPLLLEQFADALTRSAPAVHLFERAAALLRATRWSTRDLSGSRRLLAQVIAQQFSSWVMAGLSADRVDLTTQRLSDLGELTCSALLGPHPSTADIELAAVAMDTMHGYWIDRLSEPIHLAHLENDNPELAFEWRQAVAEARASQQRRRGGDGDLTPPNQLAHRRALLREVRKSISTFGRLDLDEAAERLLDVSIFRPVCVLTSAPGSIRAQIAVNRTIENINVEIDGAQLMQLLRYAQEAPSRLGVLRPQSDVLAAITGLLRPAATEILDVLADVGPDRPVAVIGDGFSRSLPWPAVPIGQNEHIVDRISWVHEPTLELIRTEPTPVPRLTAVLDGDRGHTLRWAKEESSWIVKRRHGLTFDPDVDNQIGTDPFLLHACAHGIADPVDPRQSGLVVHNTFTDTPLFLRASDLVALNAVPTMMVLSACSMGHAGLTWEASAMASPVTDTFRASGVAAVTSYLSPCSDRSAFVLSTYLHYRLEGGATLEEAVRSTQLWAKRSSDRELRSWVTSNTTIETLSDPALLRRAGTWGTLSVSGW